MWTSRALTRTSLPARRRGSDSSISCPRRRGGEAVRTGRERRSFAGLARWRLCFRTSSTVLSCDRRYVRVCSGRSEAERASGSRLRQRARASFSPRPSRSRFRRSSAVASRLSCSARLCCSASQAHSSPTRSTLCEPVSQRTATRFGVGPTYDAPRVAPPLRARAEDRRRARPLQAVDAERAPWIAMSASTSTPRRGRG